MDSFFVSLCRSPALRIVQARYERLHIHSRGHDRQATYYSLCQVMVSWLKARYLKADATLFNHEWNELSYLLQRVNPYYPNLSQVESWINQAALFSAEQRHSLLQVLRGYLSFVVSHLPSAPADHVLSRAVTQSWLNIFPRQWAWSSVEILLAAGYHTVFSKDGYRMYMRWSEGRLQPSYSYEDYFQWWDILEGFVKHSEAAISNVYLLDFMAANLAGEYATHQATAVCTAIPSCEQCEIQENCALAVAHNADQRQQMAQRILEQMDSNELMQGLFELEVTPQVALGKHFSRQELDEWAQQTRLSPKLIDLLWEASSRCSRSAEPGQLLKTGHDVHSLYKERLHHLNHEQFWTVFLSSRGRIIGEELISKGVLNQATVHPREIFRPAIESGSASIIIVHNHPSGDPSPSPSDVALTKQIQQVGKIVGIDLLDHVIIGRTDYISLREMGLLGS